VHIQVKPFSESSSVAPVSRSTVVIKTPLTLTMSYYDAVDYRPPSGKTTASGAAVDDRLATNTNDNGSSTSPFFSSHGVKLPSRFFEAVGPEETMAFFLMGQSLRGKDGFWYPYLRTLPHPEELTTPLYFDGEEAFYLTGTSLASARVSRLQIWRLNYDNAVEVLKECGFEGVDKYTW
jgi:hypothetical protein